MENVIVDSSSIEEGRVTHDQPYLVASDPRFNGHLQNASCEVEQVPNVYEVRRYKTNKTVWPTILSLTIQVILLAVVLQLGWYCSKGHCSVEPSSIAVYLNSAIWLYTVVIHEYIRRQRDVLHRHGYGRFYRITSTSSTLPRLIFSAGNIVLLVFVIILCDLNCYNESDVKEQDCKLGLDKLGWIQIVIGLEVVLAFLCFFIYLVQSLQFNKCRQTPDIFHDSPLDQDNLLLRRDIGFRSQTMVEELLERQSDAIAYLKLRCEHLSRTIFQLTNENHLRHESLANLNLEFNTSETQHVIQNE